MLTLDHLVIASETLEEGVAHVRDKLGVEIPFGGKHPLMGTHNHLMQFGSEAFLGCDKRRSTLAIDRAGRRWDAL